MIPATLPNTTIYRSKVATGHLASSVDSRKPSCCKARVTTSRIYSERLGSDRNIASMSAGYITLIGCCLLVMPIPVDLNLVAWLFRGVIKNINVGDIFSLLRIHAVLTPEKSKLIFLLTPKKTKARI